MALADAKRAYFRQAVGTTSATAEEDLETLYYEKARVGTAVIMPEASTTVEGTVKQAAFIAQVTPDFATLAAATTAYNALLTALKNAGIMASS